MRHNSYTTSSNANEPPPPPSSSSSSSSLLLLLSSCSKTTTICQNVHQDNLDLWQRTELTIKENLMQFESARKFCAYCGLREADSAETSILGRCYGCQMVYYCSQEHQHLDWLENHMPKCAELEWVALGELIESIPVALPLPTHSMSWPVDRAVATWTDWFEVRQDTVVLVRQMAKTLETKLFSSSGTTHSQNWVLILPKCFFSIFVISVCVCVPKVCLFLVYYQHQES